MNHVMKLMLAASVLALPALAQPVDMEGRGGERGRLARQADGVLVSLSAQARRTVAQDRLNATVAIEKDGATAQEVQAFINRKMQDAQKIYAKYKDVKVRTGGYHVWKQYQDAPEPRQAKPAPRVERWRGSQQLVLEGPAGSDLLKLMGELQAEGFAAQGMVYSLSPEAAERLTDELTEEALGKIRARAAKIGATLESPRVEFVSVNTDGGYTPPMPMMRAMKAEIASAAADMAAPVGEAGDTDVTVNVQATVKLKK